MIVSNKLHFLDILSHKLQYIHFETGDVDLNCYQLFASDDASEDGNEGLHKRWYFPGGAAWKTFGKYKAQVFALNAVASVLSGCGDQVVEFGRSALCASTNGQYGCLSWSGGGHSMVCSIGKSIILQGISGMGEFAYVSEHASHCFESSAWHSCCLSNRPDGCS